MTTTINDTNDRLDGNAALHGLTDAELDIISGGGESTDWRDYYKFCPYGAVGGSSRAGLYTLSAVCRAQ